MKQTFNQQQQTFVELGNQCLIENIKILLYQTDPTIFDRIDFDDDNIYKQPLLFAYFKNSSLVQNTLETILYHH